METQLLSALCTCLYQYHLLFSVVSFLALSMMPSPFSRHHMIFIVPKKKSYFINFLPVAPRYELTCRLKKNIPSEWTHTPANAQCRVSFSRPLGPGLAFLCLGFGLEIAPLRSWISVSLPLAKASATLNLMWRAPNGKEPKHLGLGTPRHVVTYKPRTHLSFLLPWNEMLPEGSWEAQDMFTTGRFLDPIWKWRFTCYF